MYFSGQVVWDIDNQKPFVVGSDKSTFAWDNVPKNSTHFICAKHDPIFIYSKGGLDRFECKSCFGQYLSYEQAIRMDAFTGSSFKGENVLEETQKLLKNGNIKPYRLLPHVSDQNHILKHIPKKRKSKPKFSFCLMRHNDPIELIKNTNGFATSSNVKHFSSEKNVEIVYKATKDYLEGIAKLQEDIRQKYENDLEYDLNAIEAFSNKDLNEVVQFPKRQEIFNKIWTQEEWDSYRNLWIK